MIKYKSYIAVENPDEFHKFYNNNDVNREYFMNCVEWFPMWFHHNTAVFKYREKMKEKWREDAKKGIYHSAGYEYNWVLKQKSDELNKKHNIETTIWDMRRNKKLDKESCLLASDLGLTTYQVDPIG